MFFPISYPWRSFVTVYLLAVFTIAKLVGFVALFALSGIGVSRREMLVDHCPLVGVGPAIVVAGLGRLWHTVYYLFLAGFAWWLLKPEMLRIRVRLGSRGDLSL